MKDIVNIVLIFALVLLVLYKCSDNKDSPIHVYQKEDSLMKVNVGRKILCEKDSLTIVDYSFWNDTYTLSNGVKVNKNLVK